MQLRYPSRVYFHEVAFKMQADGSVTDRLGVSNEAAAADRRIESVPETAILWTVSNMACRYSLLRDYAPSDILRHEWVRGQAAAFLKKESL